MVSWLGRGLRIVPTGSTGVVSTKWTDPHRDTRILSHQKHQGLCGQGTELLMIHYLIDAMTSSFETPSNKFRNYRTI